MEVSYHYQHSYCPWSDGLLAGNIIFQQQKAWYVQKVPGFLLLYIATHHKTSYLLFTVHSTILYLAYFPPFNNVILFSFFSCLSNEYACAGDILNKSITSCFVMIPCWVFANFIISSGRLILSISVCRTYFIDSFFSR